jgi:hypothetical protein
VSIHAMNTLGDAWTGYRRPIGLQLENTAIPGMMYGLGDC